MVEQGPPHFKLEHRGARVAITITITEALEDAAGLERLEALLEELGAEYVWEGV